MNKSQHDDIAAICSHTGMNPSEYRSFESRSDKPASPATEDPPFADEAIVSLRGGFAKRKPGPDGPGPGFKKPEGWRALRSVFETENGSAGQERENEGRTLPMGSISLFGACGGIGATTILATLGRVLSLRRERVLLADGSAETMLPFYFGASDFVTGSYSFQPPRDAADGPVLIISRDGKADDEARLWDSVRSSRRSMDRILLDATQNLSSSSREIMMSESVCLVVLTPDLHSAVRMRSLERAFHRHEEATGTSVSSFYLLNKFDRSLALHTDIRNWLAQQLGNRLLPLFIRRSDEVTQALAEGLTVTDYAPNAGVTEDFHALADWLQGSHVGVRPAFAAGGSH